MSDIAAKSRHSSEDVHTMGPFYEDDYDSNKLLKKIPFFDKNNYLP